MSGFCTNCGAPLSAAFCTRCGQRVQSPGSPVQADVAQAGVEATQQAPPLQSQPAVTQPQLAAIQSVSAPQPAPAPTPVQQAPAAPAQAQGSSDPGLPDRAGVVRVGVEAQVSPAAPSAQPVSSAPVNQSAAANQSAAGKSSGIGKALLIIGGIVLVFCLAAFGAVLYGVHWAKGKVSSITGGAIGGSGQVQVANGHACDLLSTADLQQVLGVTVERSSEIMENNEPGCAYYTNPAAFAELQKIAVEQARRDSEKASKDPALNNSKNDNPLALLGHTEEMEGIVKGLGLSQPDKDGKVFSFTIERNFGSSNWGTLRTTISIVPGFKEIDGVGDHAMMGSFGHDFYVLKGDSMFHLDTMYVPETRVRGAELARKLVAHY